MAQRTRKATARVVLDFSFAERAERLLGLASELLGRPRRPVLEGTAPRSLPEAALASIPRPRDDAFWCPVCESFVPEFRPFGVAKRPNAQCPSCGALERHRSAWLFLKHATDLCDGRDKLLLHPSPERHLGRLLPSLPGVRYLSSDIAPPAVSLALDLTRIPFPDRTFDSVYCSHVLEHIENDHQAMAELLRILKPSGWALVMTPIQGDTTNEDPSLRTKEERLAHFGQVDHVRIYGRDIRGRLAEAGFEVAKHSGELGLAEPYRRFMGLKGTFIYLCTRPSVPRAASGGPPTVTDPGRMC